ncbi:hypothetical protein MMPV_000757 [Pyropia vietnamensis]
MNRISSFVQLAQAAKGEADLPAGADPYEDFDFSPYLSAEQTEEDLRKTWRVFTKVKDVLDDGRRLENASWRLWFRERNKAAAAAAAEELGGQEASGSLKPRKPAAVPTEAESAAALNNLQLDDLSLDKSLARAENKTSRMVGGIFGGGAGASGKEQEESANAEARAKMERTRRLLSLLSKHALGDDPALVDDLLAWVHIDVLSSSEVEVKTANSVPKAKDGSPDMVAAAEAILPRDAAAAREFLSTSDVRARKRAAAFGHSLERNGANNFLLYLLRELRDELSFDIFSPKDGPMRGDYAAMGIAVRILDSKATDYPHQLKTALADYDYVVANTIMSAPVVNVASMMKLPTLTVIHEAWRPKEMDYYAKEVFLMPHLGKAEITAAFAAASRIVFPAEVQKRCYDGLYKEEAASVVYNGIPLKSINAFRKVQSRSAVRASLGYSPDDMVLVQLGTVCKRKGQLITAQAFSKLKQTLGDGGKNLKLLMVGARYIRQHEIDYIDSIKEELESSGSLDAVTILDVKKNVLPYYLAADMILCPSLNEVLPLVICEAMAFERPVIATAIDGIPEALSDGVEGFLIPPNDADALTEAMVKLVKDEGLRREMGQRGRARVLSQFSFETMSASYREIIKADLGSLEAPPLAMD